MAVFSFHPVKHLTTGEGGMVTTSDSEKPIEIFIGASGRGEDIEGNVPDFSEFDPDVIKIDLSDLQELSEKMEAVSAVVIA